MEKIGALRNPIQEYAWGSHTAIPELMGANSPAERPQAELWMGAHPKAPSLVRCDSKWVSLLDLIEREPETILGKKTADRFANRLPYLFKVLAVANPLSIQAHPNRIQAKEGFKRENSLGIPLDAAHRNYRDDSHKPECICALTPFWVLKGFRRISDILFYCDRINPKGLAPLTDDLRNDADPEGLRRFFHALMGFKGEKKKTLIESALSGIEKHRGEDPVFDWMMTLQGVYPFDIGVLSPMILNLIRLEPNQAMFLPAGQLHAYLDGVGMELMANSDNVLRGGLTPKHVDVPELIRILDFSEGDTDVLALHQENDCEYRYPSKTDEFFLSVVSVKDRRIFHSEAERSAEILFCVSGQATITDLGDGEEIVVEKGSSVVIPAAVSGYTVKGNAKIYRAATAL
ncbi:MAG: mannose-6-phosphate isomerase, class I [Desulfobacterales bacterium]